MWRTDRPELGDFLVVEPARGLVEQEKLGRARECPRDLRALLRAEGQARDRALGHLLEAEEPEHAARLAAEPALLPAHGGKAERIAEEAARARRSGAPTMTFSSTVMVRKSARFWNVRPIPARAIAWGERVRREAPSKRMSPAAGR